MKINEVYGMFKADVENEEVQKIKNELDFCLKDFQNDINTIWELRKKIHYKHQQFNQLFKDFGATTFNSISTVAFISEEYSKGNLYKNDTNEKEFNQNIERIAANFFPKEMWDNLELLEIVKEGYSATWFYFFFIWKYGNGKLANFQIQVPNISEIKHELFNIGKEFEDVSIFRDFDWKTKVYVIPDYDPKTCCQTLNHVGYIGSSWLNNEIRDMILAKAKELEEGK